MRMVIALAVSALALAASPSQAREIATKVYPSPAEAVAGIRDSIPGAPVARAAALGTVEARVQLWRAIQRWWARNKYSSIYGFSENFFCSKVSRWRARCGFNFEASDGYHYGHGFVKEYYPAWKSPYVGKYYYYWVLDG